jgi:bacillithiol biosynthesis deacetylase BshB1
VEPVDILAIAAHPDDVELTCAGTLLRMADQGYSTGILDLTRGEMGTRGTPDLRRKEAEAAGQVIGVKFREIMDLGDSKLVNSIENRMAVAAQIRRARPRTVILPYWEGRHPDHYTTAHLGYEAAYAAGLKKADLDGEPHRPHKILYATIYYDVPATFAVDISDWWDRKMKAIECFNSQFGGDMGAIVKLYPAWERLVDRIRTQCRFYGHQIGVEYAEPFLVRELLCLNDVVDLAVPSI